MRVLTEISVPIVARTNTIEQQMPHIICAAKDHLTYLIFSKVQSITRGPNLQVKQLKHLIHLF